MMSELHNYTKARASLLPGPEAAQQEFARFLRDRLAPALRGLGFKGSGQRFHLDQDHYRGTLAIQKSKSSDKTLVEFTLEFSAVYVPTKQIALGGRLGDFLPVCNDVWWILPVGSSTDELLDDLLGAIRGYGLVALKTAVDYAGFPTDPLRERSRKFEDKAASRLSDEFTDAWRLFNTAPDDPTLVPSLLALLEGDPREHCRGTAAKLLAFVSADQSVVGAPLQSAAEQDESLSVRLMARYALALLQGAGQG